VVKDDTKSKKLLYFIIIVVVFGLGLAVFKIFSKGTHSISIIPTSGVPTDYSECIRNSRSDYNGATCSIFYSEKDSEIGKCLEMGGCNPAAADGPNGCKITFFNPNLIYPENYQECEDMYGEEHQTSIDVFDGLCSFFLNSACSGDKNTSEAVLDKCPKSFTFSDYEKFGTCEKVFGKE
jgi:hypothetical protein